MRGLKGILRTVQAQHGHGARLVLITGVDLSPRSCTVAPSTPSMQPLFRCGTLFSTAARMPIHASIWVLSSHGPYAHCSWEALGGVFAQRGHSANCYAVYPGNIPENHPPTEACMINSKQHQGCRIQGPGTRGYWWRKTADFSHSAGTARTRCAPPELLAQHVAEQTKGTQTNNWTSSPVEGLADTQRERKKWSEEGMRTQCALWIWGGRMRTFSKSDWYSRANRMIALVRPPHQVCPAPPQLRTACTPLQSYWPLVCAEEIS